MIVATTAPLPNTAKAQKIANGYVEVIIIAYIYPNITVSGATCSGSLGVEDANGYFSTSATLNATISNNQLSCAVVVPYYWDLSSLTDTITISYSVTLLGPVDAYGNSATSKETDGSAGSIPASTGGLTTVNVTTVL
jgi:hypothetical protein